VGTALLAAWSLALFVGGASVDRLYLGTDTRAPALLLGALLGALRVGNGQPRLEPAARVAGPIGLAVLAWAAFGLDGRDPATYRGLLLVVSAAGALAVLGASQARSGRLGQGLGWRPLCVIGLWSYGIYLAHWPILLAVRSRTDLGPWATTAVVVPLTVAVAGASYRLLEQPLRHRGLRAWHPPVLVPVVAVACAVAAFAGTAGARPMLGPVDEREALRALPAADDGVAAVATSAGSLPATVPAAIIPTPAPTTVATAPTTSAAPASTVPAAPTAPVVVPAPRPAGRTPRVLVVGDSVAYSLSSALTKAGRASAIEVAVRAAPACSLNTERAEFRTGAVTTKQPALCSKMVRQWPEDIQRFQPDVVALVFGGFMYDWVIDGQPAKPCEPAYDMRYGQMVDQAIETLSGVGARVVVALPAYNRVYGQLGDLDTATDCLTRVYTDAVARHADRASIMRLDLFACPTQATCDSTGANGHRLRFDGLHYRSDAALSASHWILDQVLQPASG
jgi:hypothetical protein